MLHLLTSINRVTEKVEELILTFAILTMMVNSTANAIGRYFFNQSLFFAEELNQFLIVSVTFIGLAYAVRKGRNIRMTALYDLLGQKAKKGLTLLIAIVTAGLMFYLAYQAVVYVQELKQINRLSPALQFPVYIVYSIIPLGFLMAGLQYLSGFLLNLTHPDIYISVGLTEDKQACSQGETA
ncbi:TRAP transporter small permease [Marinobacterium arenosum]|uniref:TRAP transporter small permease n=1 Tax=Marinobacterium arenosum TaxID=2862496 RepID=UPI001C95CF78|nr:TRAP transporter small permease [Marinobacterium arenosum]MBY4675819.1 TRAP transporter small permease [Marinobacterium arenosum]